MSSSPADLSGAQRPERERAARPVRGSRPAARGSRRGSPVADDTRGEGGADVPPADPHERRTGRCSRAVTSSSAETRRSSWPGAGSTTSTSTSRRSRASRPSGRTGCSGSPNRPGSASRSRSRPILATASPRASARAGRQEGSRTGPSRSASVRCGDEEAMREFGDIARREYRAVGIHVALHPMADLATEPRWARSMHTFGEDAELAGRLRRRVHPRFPGRPARAGIRRVHDQALPRRRTAARRRGSAFPLREGSGLPRRHVRVPPARLRGGLRGRDGADHAVLRPPGRNAVRRGRASATTAT